MNKMMLPIISVFIFAFSISVHTKEQWPEPAKIAYIDRCAKSLASQGYPESAGREYCTCATNGMESEFGKKEYNQMMAAQPNPNGNKYDRRLYGVFKACKQYMPKK